MPKTSIRKRLTHPKKRRRLQFLEVKLDNELHMNVCEVKNPINETQAILKEEDTIKEQDNDPVASTSQSGSLKEEVVLGFNIDEISLHAEYLEWNDNVSAKVKQHNLDSFSPSPFLNGGDSLTGGLLGGLEPDSVLLPMEQLQDCIIKVEGTSPTPSTFLDTDGDLLKSACSMLETFLHKLWICHVIDGGIHAMLISRSREKAIQRRLHFTPFGSIELSVHCRPLNIENYVKNIPSRVWLTEDSVKTFVDRCVKVVNAIRAFEVCVGVAEEKFKNAWSAISSATIDRNPYQESRYKETLRSDGCHRLVLVRKWRCAKCSALRETVKRRSALFAKQELNPHTPNTAMSEEQKLRKLEEQRKKIEASERRLERAFEKYKMLMNHKDTVLVTEDIRQGKTNCFV